MVPGSRERGRGRGRDDSECLLATPPTPAPFRDTRPRRTSGMHTGVRCARQVWWCSRPGRAPRRTGIEAEAIRCWAQWQRRSTRALTMFSAGNRRRRARGGEQGPAEVVYLCRLPIWGQPLARWRPCRPSVVPGPLQRRLLGSAPREENNHHDEDGTSNLNQTLKNGRNLGVVASPLLRCPGARHECSQRRRKTRSFYTFFSSVQSRMNWP